MNHSSYIPKIEPGLLEKKICFYETSDLAKKLYFYIYWGGKYIVDAPYEIYREYMDSFILFWIQENQMYFVYENQEFVAPEGSIVLLDCKKINHYFAKDKVKFYFFHFNGQMTQAFYDYLTAKKKPVFFLSNEQNTMPRILDLVTSGTSYDFEISLAIYQLLGNLAEKEQLKLPFQRVGINQRPVEIEKSLDYIHHHYAEKIELEQLAATANLSKYYFAKLFKKTVGTTPHKYVINYRLIQAKQLLVETNLSVEEISNACGFYNSAHFIKLFAESTNGLTPHNFRRLF